MASKPSMLPPGAAVIADCHLLLPFWGAQGVTVILDKTGWMLMHLYDYS